MTQNTCHSDSVQSFEKQLKKGHLTSFPLKAEMITSMQCQRKDTGISRPASWHLNLILQEGNTFTRIWLLSKINLGLGATFTD